MSCTSEARGQCPAGTYTNSDVSSADPTCSRTSTAQVSVVCHNADWSRTIVCPGTDVTGVAKASAATPGMCVDASTNRPHVDPGCDRPSQCIFTKKLNGEATTLGCVDPAECRTDTFKCVDGRCVWVSPGTAGSGPYGQCACADPVAFFTCDPRTGCTQTQSGGTELAACQAACKFYIDPNTGNCVASSDPNAAPGADRYPAMAMCVAAINRARPLLPVWAIVVLAVVGFVALVAVIAAVVVLRGRRKS